MALPIVLCCLLFLFGLSSAFFGLRFLRFYLGAYGFVFAGLAAAVSLDRFLSVPEPVVVTGGIAGGCAGAMACAALFEVGLFLLGAFAGGFGAYALYETRSSDFHPVLVPGLAIASGVAGVLLRNPVAIVATTILGAALSGLAGYSLLEQDFRWLAERDPEALRVWVSEFAGDRVAYLIAAGAVAIVGGAVQLRRQARERRPAGPIGRSLLR